MSSDTGLFPSNGHRIQGRSTESFIDAHDVLSRLNFKGNEVFADIGCGDGHVSMEAYDMLDDEATIYSVDVFGPSIEDMEKEVEEKGIKNIIPIQSDVADHIAIEDNTVDICLLVNVFHHFVAMEKTDGAIEELKRIIKPEGKIAVMDYKKEDTGYGPPVRVKSSPEEMEEMFAKHGLKMVQLDTEAGEDLEHGKSHYIITFGK
ncbi:MULTISPECIES: class I SAM-dependent methyltransferase [Methanobacterium]|jgi:ubiquinone/menaquinone biosynthesis C-methylase UbiE|uniref:Class I SAM-dependent methyltransferase n=1 Tax=Methanobacterium veterum TaxID=408577 RepID=A0A9E4ZTF4_9EURY|nr:MULTISPECIES: class I SAM-dependent methyltransferase [Methanobacterium]MCZ3365332.1 class I SAM-dependent methyltransferase [Methanobacterium veterum]MCZ3373083.1 class I SAM-dependent methyltransferase [Methanobacterium veterum]